MLRNDLTYEQLKANIRYDVTKKSIKLKVARHKSVTLGKFFENSRADSFTYLSMSRCESVAFPHPYG